MAGRIPKQFIDDLLQRTDIVEVIDTRVPLKKAGKDYKACCPFHDEKTPSFTVSADKQFYYCFGCHARGSAISFLMEYEHMTFPEAVEELAARAGVQIPREAGFEPEKAQAGRDLLKLLEEAARFYRQELRTSPQAQQAIDYLKGRGVTGEIAHEFGLGLAPEGWDNLVVALGRDAPTRDALVAAGLAVKKEGGGYYDRFRNRIMFPIHDYRGRIVGFGGRVMGKDEPKYLNSPETALFRKGRELYGLFRAREAIKREGRILVVEGYMDVVALAQSGINIAVATLGTAATPEHLKLLYRYAPEVVFCFDGDRAGREAAWRALDVVLPLLSGGWQASFLFLPEGEDPDTLVRKEGRDAFVDRLRTAMPVPDFLFKSLSEKVNLARQDGRARLAELAKPYLSKVPAGVLRESMLDRLTLSPTERAKLSTLVAGSDQPMPPLVRDRRPATGPAQPVSVMRLAVAMLIQHPRLAAKAPPAQEFEGLSEPGAELFRHILSWLEASPNRTTAAVVEQFRDTEEGSYVAKLAAWSHENLQQDVEAEFLGILGKLRQKAIQERTECLLQKGKLTGLTVEEKVELTQLLAGKRATEVPSEKD